MEHLKHTALYGILSVSMGFLLLHTIPSCSKNDDSDLLPKESLEEIVFKLNINVEGLQNLVEGYAAADSVTLFSIERKGDGSVVYLLGMKEQRTAKLCSEIVSEKCDVPELSVKFDDSGFYWTLNGAWMVDSDGARIELLDRNRTPLFELEGDDRIICRIGSDVVFESLLTKSDYLARDVSLDYDSDRQGFTVNLSSGQQFYLQAIKDFRFLKDNVLNDSYYKDVFLDAGIGLTSRKSLAAARYLGLSLEGISFSRVSPTDDEVRLQTEIIAGCETDLNGRLLYPDGQPRYRLLFVNGGSSRTHGKSLSKEGLDRICEFVENGGAYVGACAGAFLASNGYDRHYDYPYYLSVWPGMMLHSGLTGVHTGMFIENDSPLLAYYDFGRDHYVDSIRHNLGGYPIDLPDGTEVLARYDYPDKSDVHLQPSIWSYKSREQSGRIVQGGSHPEENSSGERRDLMAAMMQYAMDGRGPVVLKGFLKNGEQRDMVKRTEDKDPDYTVIGDLQTHHFAVYIPSGANNVVFETKSDFDCDLALMLCRDTYAFPETADCVVSEPGPSQRICFLEMEEGVWYVSVRCLTTVATEDTDYGQEYAGRVDILNGVPYAVKVSWDDYDFR